MQTQNNSQCHQTACKSVKGLVFSIKKYAINDGPGIRTTLFFKGCPLRCVWCHNPESYHGYPELMFTAARCNHCGSCIKNCPHQAISLQGDYPFTDVDKCTVCGKCVTVCSSGAKTFAGQYYSATELVDEIEKDLIFYDTSGGGMTVSGGEPLAQAEFLLQLLKSCQQKGIHTAVDTSCHARREALESIVACTDLFLCDLKHLDAATHQELTGVDNRLILDNIRWLADNKQEVIIRFPLIPGRNDQDSNIQATVEFVASLKTVRQVDLLPFNPGGREKSARLVKPPPIIENQPLPDQRMNAIRDLFQSHHIPVTIGGYL